MRASAGHFSFVCSTIPPCLDKEEEVPLVETSPPSVKRFATNAPEASFDGLLVDRIAEGVDASSRPRAFS